MKKIGLWLIIYLVFLILFNLIFFLVGGIEHNASVWISYGFIHAAYLLLVITPFLIRRSKSEAVFGFSLYSVSTAYFLIELLVGLLFSFLRLESYKPALVVQIGISGLYAIVLVMDLLASERTADSQEEHDAQMHYIQDCSARLQVLMDAVPDEKSKKQLESIYDLIHSSPSKSNAYAAQIEWQITNQIEHLEKAVARQDYGQIPFITLEIERFANKRNRCLMLSN